MSPSARGLLGWSQTELAEKIAAVSPETRSKFSYAAAALATAFLFFLRRASQAITPRPVAKSGIAPGSGVSVVGVMAVEKNAVPSSFPDQIHRALALIEPKLPHGPTPLLPKDRGVPDGANQGAPPL
jgi:hypothetical protein